MNPGCNCCPEIDAVTYVMNDKIIIKECEIARPGLSKKSFEANLGMRKQNSQVGDRQGKM
jgi:hypothetical protein